MKSTIALLFALLGVTMAMVPPGGNIDGGLFYGLTQQSATLYGATSTASQVRNSYTKKEKSKGKGDKKTKVPKIAKSKGKGKGKGKACPKSRKTQKAKDGKMDKSKGKGKGSKKSLAPSVSAVPSSSPSRVPTVAPTVSSVPSEAPSESFQPSGSWCIESEHPTVTATPSVSAGPSASPSVSSAPTVSSQPSDSSAPSASPSVSSAPSHSSQPSSLPSSQPSMGPTGVGRSGILAAPRSICINLYANYTDDEIFIGKNETYAKDATAGAVIETASPEVASPQDTVGLDSYNVEFTFEVNGAVNASEIGEAFDETLTPSLVLAVLGCKGKARQVAEAAYFEVNPRPDIPQPSKRKLQQNPLDKTGVLTVMKNWNCGDGEVEANTAVTCSTDGHYDGKLSAEEFQADMKFQVESFTKLMDDVHKDWYMPQNVTNVNVGMTKNSVNGVMGSQQSQRAGVKAGPFIGAATGMLAVLLLLVLFVRRRRRYDDTEVSHLKLDEDDEMEDDTFYNGSDGTGHEHEYVTRDAHIVGEVDSVVSHWTGYTGRPKPNRTSYNRDGLMRGRSADVHQCSSATCDLCDNDRRGGVNFIKTGTASSPTRAPSLPSDASRDYIAEDTVQL